jgi:hypothetical protein
MPTTYLWHTRRMGEFHPQGKLVGMEYMLTACLGTGTYPDVYGNSSRDICSAFPSTNGNGGHGIHAHPTGLTLE